MTLTNCLDENTTFGEWAEKWIKYKSVGMSYSYHNTISSQVAHLTKVVGNIPVKDIRTMQLNDVIEELAFMNPNTNRPASKKFLKEIRNDAIQIFYFVADNCIGFDYNPARRVTIPKNSVQNERRSLTEKEIGLVLKLQHKARPAVLIMMLCGLRVGEMLPLRWDDIDFENKIVHINKSTQRVSGNEFTVKKGTKNGKNRNIPIPSTLVDELTETKTLSKSPYICPNSSGVMHTPSSWKRIFESYVIELNALNNNINKYNPNFRKSLDKITAHMLRHTYASMLYFAGVDVLTAQKLLGHSDVSTTLNVYTHLQSQTEKYLLINLMVLYQIYFLRTSRSGVRVPSGAPYKKTHFAMKQSGYLNVSNGYQEYFDFMIIALCIDFYADISVVVY